MGPAVGYSCSLGFWSEGRCHSWQQSHVKQRHCRGNKINLAGFQQIIKCCKPVILLHFPLLFLIKTISSSLSEQLLLLSLPCTSLAGSSTTREGAGQRCRKCCLPEGFLISSPAFPGQNWALLAALQTAPSIKPGTSCC